MPLSKAHKLQTRERIVDAAAKMFRAHGYDGVGVDGIMAEAGLTRGGFYAHFPSKADLLAEVLSSRHDLIRRLSERDGATAIELREQAATILCAYVSPKNLDKVGPNCTLSTLNLDAARTSTSASTAYTDALKRLIAEIERGPQGQGKAVSRDIATKTASLAIGALSLARTCNDQILRHAILTAASGQISQWLRSSQGDPAEDL